MDLTQNSDLSSPVTSGPYFYFAPGLTSPISVSWTLFHYMAVFSKATWEARSGLGLVRI